MDKDDVTDIFVALCFIIITVSCAVVAWNIAKDTSDIEALGADKAISTIEQASRSQELVLLQTNNRAVYCMSQETLQNVKNLLEGQSQTSPN